MTKLRRIDRNSYTIFPRMKVPTKMDWMGVSNEQAKSIHRVSMGIFTDMSNGGYSISEAIEAVYVSGLNHGMELSND
ncbi:hypothetical protein [Kiloniella litopenaei]|uniref:hypothetical protein n=1 Tax=Kiloniella litopenaei TaxID=1549748 RepID=UPI003BADB809